jgi:hypothetical protein
MYEYNSGSLEMGIVYFEGSRPFVAFEAIHHYAHLGINTRENYKMYVGRNVQIRVINENHKVPLRVFILYLRATILGHRLL